MISENYLNEKCPYSSLVLSRINFSVWNGYFESTNTTKKQQQQQQKISCDEKRTQELTRLNGVFWRVSESRSQHISYTIKNARTHTIQSSITILLLKMIGFAFSFYQRYSHFDLIGFYLVFVGIENDTDVFFLFDCLFVCWHVSCASFVRSLDCYVSFDFFFRSSVENVINWDYNGDIKKTAETKMCALEDEYVWWWWLLLH